MDEQVGRYDSAPAPDGGRRWYPSSGPAGPLRWLAEGFCRNFSAAASAPLRAELGVRLTGLVRGRRSAFAASLEELTCSYVLRGQRFAGDLWVEFSPRLAVLAVERLLGGSAERPGEARALTALERGVLHRLAEAVAVSLTAAWPGPDRPDLRAERRCAPPAAGGGEGEVLVATFELALGECVETMRLCADAAALGGELPDDPAGRAAEAPLELSAGIEPVRLDAADLAELAPGDIIATDTPTDGEIIVRVGGIPKFAARLALRDDRRVLTIIRRLDDPDPAPRP